MNTNERPAHGRQAADRGKRFRRAVPLVTAAAVSAAMVASAAGPASAATREPAQAAPGLLAFGADALPNAAALAAAAPYVHVADGRVTFDAAGAQKAGVSSQALDAEGAVAGGLNQLLVHESALAGGAHDELCPAPDGSATFTVPWFGIPSCSGLTIFPWTCGCAMTAGRVPGAGRLRAKPAGQAVSKKYSRYGRRTIPAKAHSARASNP